MINVCYDRIYFRYNVVFYKVFKKIVDRQCVVNTALSCNKEVCLKGQFTQKMKILAFT